MELYRGREDIWYATNIQICDYIRAFRSLVTSVDGRYLYNPTVTPLWLIYSDGDFMNSAITLKPEPGESVTLVDGATSELKIEN